MATLNWPLGAPKMWPISARSCDSSKPEHSTRRLRRLIASTRWCETRSPRRESNYRYPKATSRIIITANPSMRQMVAKSTFPAR